MGLFDFLKKKKTELTDEQIKWSKMWELWSEGRVDSPYAELMTYQGEINNGGHDQYFTNLENTGDLQKEMFVLESILPTRHKDNLKKAYEAYLALEEKRDSEKAGKIIGQCDDVFYENEEEINNILKEFAAKINL